MPRVSVAVLIVNFKAYGHLQRCLKSLDPCLDPGDEVVVVDNESDPRLLQQALADHPRVTRLPSSKNLGFAAAVNLAARNCRSTYLFLLNPDTELQGPVLRTLESWLEHHPSDGVVGPRVVNADGTVQASARRFPDVTTLLGGRSSSLTRVFPNNWFSERNLIGRAATEPIRVDWVSGACLMTSRELFERMGGLDESFFLYWEDADYCGRAALAGRVTMYLPAVCVKHEVGVSAVHDRGLAIREFHASAYRLYLKSASPAGRLAAPLVRVVLGLRCRLCLVGARFAGTDVAAAKATDQVRG